MIGALLGVLVLLQTSFAGQCPSTPHYADNTCLLKPLHVPLNTCEAHVLGAGGVCNVHNHKVCRLLLIIRVHRSTTTCCCVYVHVVTHPHSNGKAARTLCSLHNTSMQRCGSARCSGIYLPATDLHGGGSHGTTLQRACPPILRCSRYMQTVLRL